MAIVFQTHLDHLFAGQEAADVADHFVGLFVLPTGEGEAGCVCLGSRINLF
jgi:hypothetical protein